MGFPRRRCDEAGLLLPYAGGGFKAAMGVREFYDDHPISEARVLAALTRARGGVAPVTADDLFEFDQDHYGGLAAVDAMARRAGVGAASRILDLCAGLGGPARFLASRRGATVIALELHAGRAAGAARLNRLVRETRVAVVRGDATTLPFRRGAFDACVSQEALMHVSDKPRVLAECHRVLASGGRLVFSDWIAYPSLGDRERDRLWEWMAATTLQTLESYRRLLGLAGFTAVEAEDVSSEWRPIVRQRVEAHRALRDDRTAWLGERRYREYEQLHAFFAELVDSGKLGGGRFSATR
jgi:sarcosine/dimethylglycine N-methyltransferase